MNIKNEATERLVKELAEETGESLTGAIHEAVREKLERVRRNRSGLAAKLNRIGTECAAHLKEPYRTIDHGEMLYDQKGLPK